MLWLTRSKPRIYCDQSLGAKTASRCTGGSHVIEGVRPLLRACGLVGIFTVSLFAAEGALAFTNGWQGGTAVSAKRGTFRPVGRTTRQVAPVTRWRPHANSGYGYRGMQPTARVAYPLGLPAPAPTSRFAVVPRNSPWESDAFGRRFRPHDTEATASIDTTPAVAPAQQAAVRSAQFRPAPAKRKQAYEQVYAGAASSSQYYPSSYGVRSYMPASPFASYSGYWPLQ